MGQWTKQMGFPLITLKVRYCAFWRNSAQFCAILRNSSDASFPLITLKDYTPNPKDGTVALSLEQSWFLADGSTPEPDLVDGSEKMWMVPIFAQASGGDVRPGGRPIGRPPEAGEADASPEEMSLMPAAKSYSMSVKGDGQWVKLNAGQHVPLRVKYPDSMIPALCEAVKAKAVGAADRIGILSDQAALTKAGLLDPALYLQVLAAYAAEDDATVWGMVLEQLAGLHALLVGGGAPELLGLFDTFARSLLLPKLAELGWTPRDSDGHLTRKLRGELICVLPNFCATDAAVVGEARRRFDAFVAAPEGDGAKELPAEYQEAVYKLVLKNGGEKEFDQILGLFDSLTLNTARKAALQGLGAAPTDALRTRALEFAIGGKVKLQDLFYVAISMHTSGEAGLNATWAFFKENLPKYTELYDKASASLMDAVISGACRSFATAEKAAEVKAFFAAQALPKNERTIAQLTESIETNAKYADAVRASKAKAWLEARG